MTSQSPRIYTYKITFEEVPYYYYGVHKEKYFNEEYWGSPVTHKWMWNFYTPKKQVLEIFEYNDEGWLEAQEVEKRVIKPFYNDDKWCLNEHYGSIISLQVSRETGKKCFEQKLGIHLLSKEEKVENGRNGGSVGGKISYENKLGFHSFSKEERFKYGKIGGDKCYENKSGIHSLSKEMRVKYCRMGGLIGGKKGGKLTGKENAKKLNSQVWECTITGHRSNPGGLSKYQRARGIDTTKRVRIS